MFPGCRTARFPVERGSFRKQRPVARHWNSPYTRSPKSAYDLWVDDAADAYTSGEDPKMMSRQYSVPILANSICKHIASTARTLIPFSGKAAPGVDSFVVAARVTSVEAPKLGDP